MVWGRWDRGCLERCGSLLLPLWHIARQIYCLSSVSHRSGWGEVSTGFSARGLTGWDQCVSQPALLRRILGRIGFQAHPGCWHSSAPCSCWTRVSISWLLTKGLPQLLEASWHPLAPGPLHLQSQLWPVESFSHFESLWPPLGLISPVSSQRKFSASKGLS